MNAHKQDYLNDLAGRIEGVGRVLFHLVAMLEDTGTIDGQRLAGSLRNCIMPKDEADVLLTVAKRTANRAADALDEAREWRESRRPAGHLVKRMRCKLRLVK